MYIRRTRFGVPVLARTPQDKPASSPGYRSQDGSPIDSPVWPPAERLSLEEMQELIRANRIPSLLAAAITGRRPDPYYKEAGNAKLLVRLQEDAAAYAGVMRALAREGVIGISCLDRIEKETVINHKLLGDKLVEVTKITSQPMWLVVHGTDLSGRPMTEFGVQGAEKDNTQRTPIPNFSLQNIPPPPKPFSPDSSPMYYRHERAIGITPDGVLLQVHRQRTANANPHGAIALLGGNNGIYNLGPVADFVSCDELFDASRFATRIAPSAVRMDFLLRVSRAIGAYAGEAVGPLYEANFDSTVTVTH